MEPDVSADELLLTKLDKSGAPSKLESTSEHMQIHSLHRRCA